MRLYSFWILALSKNLKQIVVGQEVESGEDLAFRLQIHIQRFLDFFQLAVHVVQLL